jgi:hypothetical protein
MSVTRIVANLNAPNPAELAKFYVDVFGLLAMARALTPRS